MSLALNPAASQPRRRGFRITHFATESSEGSQAYAQLRGGNVCSIREVKLDCDSFTQDSAAVIEICSRLDYRAGVRRMSKPGVEAESEMPFTPVGFWSSI